MEGYGTIRSTTLSTLIFRIMEDKAEHLSLRALMCIVEKRTLTWKRALALPLYL